MAGRSKQTTVERDVPIIRPNFCSRVNAVQLDFVQLCRDYGIKYIQETDEWVNVECPICHHTGTRGFKGGFNIAGGYYHCWNCGGHPVDLVLAQMLNLSALEIPAILYQYTGSLVLRRRLEDKKKINHPSKIKLPCETFTQLCRNYLTKRGFDPSFLRAKYHLVGAPYVGQWAGRLIIPIYYNGKLVSFQGRALMSKKRCKELGMLRYKTLSKEESVVDPKTILYNLDNCRGKKLILVEGPFDAMRIGDDAAGTLGTTTTPEQRALIHKRFKEVFIVFDPEPEAQERAAKLADQLDAGFGLKVHVVDTELGHDPGAMTEEEVSKLRKALRV